MLKVIYKTLIKKPLPYVFPVAFQGSISARDEEYLTFL